MPTVQFISSRDQERKAGVRQPVPKERDMSCPVYRGAQDCPRRGTQLLLLYRFPESLSQTTMFKKRTT
ncbi:hypothetical protein cypCar_00044975 [Cyprinus carpio]|nr:hypothetical protein cypCar_00044975 [Cyprinus carpio]